MHSANQKRIAWYLGLQHVLRLPRHSFAPRVGLGRHHGRSMDDNVEDTHKGLEQIHAYGSRRLSSRLVRASSPHDHLPALRSAKEHGPSTHLPGKKAVVEVAKSKGIALQNPPALRRLTVRNGEDHVVQRSHARPADKSGAGGDGKFHASSYAQLTSSRLAMSTGNDSGTMAGSRAQIYRPLANRSISERASASRELRALSPVRRPDVEPDPRRQGEPSFESDERAPLDSNASSEFRIATASTIHLDGSALGRWALQYLERSLGRPTTGMTGIDPRASLPRTRIAPF